MRQVGHRKYVGALSPQQGNDARMQQRSLADTGAPMEHHEPVSFPGFGDLASLPASSVEHLPFCFNERARTHMGTS